MSQNDASAAFRSAQSPKPVRFFLAGVSKAGTTALYDFLGQHSEIYLSPIKEPSYFAASDFLALQDPKARSTIRERIKRSEQWFAGELTEVPQDGFTFDLKIYEALFHNVGKQVAIGEGSTTYWYAPQAARAIFEYCPDARFVLMLRNPADRFFSQYLTTRWQAPLASCRDYFHLALERRQGWGLVLDMGYYATNLKRFFEYFPRSAFSIHIYEDFATDPQEVCKEIFQFLGANPNFTVDTDRKINAPSLPRAPLLHAMYRSMPGSKAIRNFIPQTMRGSLRELFLKPRDREQMHPADRRTVTDYYRDQILETAQLIDRDLSAWLS